MSHTLLIFLKEPQKGRVKTRLAKTLGDNKAYQIYCDFLKMIEERVATLNCEVQIFFDSTSNSCSILTSIFGEDKSYHPQLGGSLGDKLKQGFEFCFRKNPKDQYIVIGGDSPDMPLSFLIEGFSALSQGKSVVVGGTEDGGYYMLGLSQFLPQVFENISWGSEKVFTETLECLKKNQLSYLCLPTWFDIDTEEDFKQFLHRNVS